MGSKNPFNKIFEPIYGKPTAVTSSSVPEEKTEEQPKKAVKRSMPVKPLNAKSSGLSLYDGFIADKRLLVILAILVIVVAVVGYLIYKQKQQKKYLSAVARRLKKLKKYDR
jgi:hypothetical protein